MNSIQIVYAVYCYVKDVITELLVMHVITYMSVDSCADSFLERLVTCSEETVLDERPTWTLLLYGFVYVHIHFYFSIHVHTLFELCSERTSLRLIFLTIIRTTTELMRMR